MHISTVFLFLVASMLAVSATAISVTHAESVHLWVPHTMVMDGQYHGVVISDAAIPERSTVFLSVDDDSIVMVPESITVDPHKNHASFLIILLNPGSTKIHALSDGALYSAAVTVVSSQSTPDSLKITLATNKTKIDSVMGHLAVYDQKGLPVRVDADIHADMTVTGAVSAPDTVIIKNGTSGTRFEVEVRGAGSIIASADRLHPDSADMERLYDKFTVHVAVAPDIALPDSFVHYYVWLQKDGKPYSPARVMDGVISSGNFDVGRFEQNPAIKKFDGTNIRLVDGVATGMMYTGKPGHATVTVSVPGIGIAQDDLFVGPIRFDGVSVNDVLLEPPEIVLAQQNLLYADHVADGLAPNVLMSWVYPPVTNGQAWMVVATYSTDTSTLLQSQTSDDSARAPIRQDTVLIPTPSDMIQLSISSGTAGLEHDSIRVMIPTLMKTNAIEIPMYGATHGSHDISVSAQNLQISTARLDIVSDHTADLSLRLTGLPAVYDDELAQDIAMVSVVDSDGATVDAHDMIGRNLEFGVFADNNSVQLSEDAILLKHPNSAIIRGIIQDSGAQISATLDGIGSVLNTIHATSPKTTLEILAPERVHVNEDFPFAVHRINDDGIPLEKIDDIQVFSSDAYTVTNNHMRIEKSGPSVMHVTPNSAGSGVAEHKLTGFANEMELELHLEKKSFRIGEDVVLDITSSVAADMYLLLTDYPFEKTGDAGFLIRPDTESDAADITVVAEKEGYQTSTASATISVRETFLVDVKAADSDGNRIAVPFEMMINDGNATDGMSPYHAELGPVQLAVKLPQTVSIDDAGYVLSDLSKDGMTHHGNQIDVFLDQDTRLDATYDRVVLVSLGDGVGSGVYRYGETVHISAPDKQRLSFLVRDVFDHWKGLGPDQAPFKDVSFTATEDVDATAIYREDYTYLMLMVLVPLLTGGIYAVSKNITGFRWTVQNLLEHLPVWRLSIPKKQKQTKKKV